MTAYRLRTDANVVRTSDGAIIPPDPRNCDHMAYQSWLAAGNAPEPVPITPPTSTGK